VLVLGFTREAQSAVIGLLVMAHLFGIIGALITIALLSLTIIVIVEELWLAPQEASALQQMGIGGLIVPGTVRDSLFILDAILNRDGGPRPEVVITDTASYSDIVFGLFAICGYQFSPRIADITAACSGSTPPPATGRSMISRVTGSALIGSCLTGPTCSGSRGR
jgi:Tn3 transposase DDE domain